MNNGAKRLATDRITRHAHREPQSSVPEIGQCKGGRKCCGRMQLGMVSGLVGALLRSYAVHLHPQQLHPLPPHLIAPGYLLVGNYKLGSRCRQYVRAFKPSRKSTNHAKTRQGLTIAIISMKAFAHSNTMSGSTIHSRASLVLLILSRTLPRSAIQDATRLFPCIFRQQRNIIVLKLAHE